MIILNPNKVERTEALVHFGKVMIWTMMVGAVCYYLGYQAALHP